MSKLVNRLPTFTSEDGTLIQDSPHSGAGWRGVALNPWSEELPFIAEMSPGWIEDQGLEHLLESFNAESHIKQFGSFRHEQEARYVAALCQDPEMMEYMMENHQAMNTYRETPLGNVFTDFPAYIYDEPVNLTPEEAYALTVQSAEKSAAKRKAKKLTKTGTAVKVIVKSKEREAEEDAAIAAAASKPLNSANACEIRMNIMEQYGMNFLHSLDVIAKSDIRMMTWEEWKKKHGGDA